MALIHRWSTLDAGSMTLTGTTVTAINDLVGTKHLSTVVNTPTLSRKRNNHDVIDFASAAKLYSASGTDVKDSYTVITVGNYDNNNYDYMFGGGSGLLRFRRYGGDVYVDINLRGAVDRTSLLHYITIDPVVSSLGTENGELDTSNTATALGTAFAVGGHYPNGAGGLFDGWWGETRIYMPALTAGELDAEIAIVEALWADTSVKVQILPPTGYDYINMVYTEPTLPTDSILKGDTFVIGDQVAFQTTANHAPSSTTGTVTLDEFAVPAILGTGDDGTWTFDYWIKDANGDNSATYTVTRVIGAVDQKLTLNGTNAYMSIPPQTLNAGDTAEIIFNRLAAPAGSDDSFFDNGVISSRLRLFISTSGNIAFVPSDIDVTIDGVAKTNGQNINGYNDGLDHVIRITMKAGITRTLAFIGDDYLRGKPYGGGVLHTLKLVVGGVTTQWDISSGSTTTEAASIGTGIITYNNVIAADWA